MDHYKFWRIDPPLPWQETVKFFGQCDKDKWTGIIYPAEFIGNPVVKTHGETTTGIESELLHYAVYRLQPVDPQPDRQVTFVNQFTGGDRQKWIVGPPEWLLVPMGKSLEGEPEPQPQRGNHFACYPVRERVPFPAKITLQDQIDKRLEKTETVEQLVPLYFCIPVDKYRIDRDPEPRFDACTDLAIYEIIPSDGPVGVPVYTVDQFAGSRRTTVQIAVWLGVPCPEATCQRLE